MSSKEQKQKQKQDIVEIVCPRCNGEKGFDRYDGWAQNWYVVRCNTCNGRGKIKGTKV